MATTHSRVLGIDPGLVVTGLGLVERVGDRLRLVGHAEARPRASEPLPRRLQAIYEAVGAAVDRWKPDAVSVEAVFFHKNVKSAVLLAHARAAAIVAAASRGVELAEYSPLEIKQCVVGYGRADKNQVQRMVHVLLGGADLPKSDHISDALAAAICHLNQRVYLVAPGKQTAAARTLADAVASADAARRKSRAAAAAKATPPAAESASSKALLTLAWRRRNRR